MLKSKPISEKQIEQYLKQSITEIGGICEKFMASRKGVPDRIIIHKNGMFFVELKAPDGKLSPSQKKVIYEYTARKALVLVIDAKDQIDLLVEILKNQYLNLESARKTKLPLGVNYD